MARLAKYHKGLEELLDAGCPEPGRGHTWLLRAAANLRHYHGPEAVFQFLRAVCDQWADRKVPDDEIRKTIRKAFSPLPSGPRGKSSIPWPPAAREKIEAILAPRAAPGWWGFPAFRGTASEILPRLFNAGEFVCTGAEADAGETRTLEEVLAAGPEGLQFIVPNPMRGRLATTSEGRPSPRCKANILCRRFLVVESDSVEKEAQARILDFLGGFLPLVMVVDSGGKSLHGWFYVEGLQQEAAEAFFRVACALGADSALWVPCQWVRLPGGTRAGESPRIQRIVYFEEGGSQCP
jgi:hypothetical protein